MRRRLAAGGTLALIALVATAVLAPAAGQRSQLDVDRYLRQHAFVGTALVARGDRVLLARGYGFANLDPRIPNTVRTRYRVTWLASQFTDVALLRLVDFGALTLDGSICRLIPQCPASWRRVTLSDLETNKARFARPTDRLDPEAPLGRWIDAMRGQQPIWRSVVHGVDVRGTDLVKQFLVERASGRSWWEYVRARILVPAGMTHTGYDAPGRGADEARAYDGTRPLRERDSRATADRADGISSTVGDFLRYSRALDGGRILSAASRRELSEFVPGSMIKGSYGVWRYGWLLTRMFGHLFQGQHAHGEPGWSSWFMRFPNDRLTIILFQNRTQGAGEAATGLAGLLLGCPPGAPSTPEPC